MNISRTTARIAALLGTMVVVVAVAASAQASSSKPAAMSKTEYQALMSRSEALNARYGNAVTRLSPKQFAALYEAGADRLAPQELAALVARSEALNSRYGLGASAGSAHHGSVLATEKPVVSPASAFNWGDFGIGAAAMLGLLLLTGGLVAGSRYGRRVPRARVS